MGRKTQANFMFTQMRLQYGMNSHNLKDTTSCALMYKAIGQNELASQMMEQVLSQNSTSPHFLVSAIYMDIDSNRVIELSNQLIGLKVPASALGFLMRGEAFSEQELYEHAHADFSQSIATL